MTGEEFRLIYTLGDRLTGPPVVSYRATDVAGSPVLIHFLVGNQDVDRSALLDSLSDLDPARKARVREVTEVDGRPTVVTDEMTDFSTFQDWASRTETEGSPAEVPGAYTQLFRIPETQSGLPQPVTESVEPDSDLSPAEVGPIEPDAGAPGPDREAQEEPEPASEGPYRGVSSSKEEGFPVGEAPPPSDQPEGFLAPGPSPVSFPGGESLSDLEQSASEGGGSESPGSYTMFFGGGAGETPPAGGIRPQHGEEANFEEPQEQAVEELEAPPASGPVFPSPPAKSEESREERESPNDGGGVRGGGGAPDVPAAGQTPGQGGGKDGKPGAYTQIFGRPRESGGAPPEGKSPPVYSPAPPSPRPPPPPPPNQGGSPPDWQRWRDTPGAAGQHIPSDDYLSRLGGSSTPPPAGSAAGPATGGVTPQPPSDHSRGTGTPPAGPGHYTMVREGITPDSRPLSQAGLSGGPPPGTPLGPSYSSPAAEARSTSPPAPRPSFLAILGLVAVFLALVAVVVLFAVFG